MDRGSGNLLRECSKLVINPKTDDVIIYWNDIIIILNVASLPLSSLDSKPSSMSVSLLTRIPEIENISV